MTVRSWDDLSAVLIHVLDLIPTLVGGLILILVPPALNLAVLILIPAPVGFLILTPAVLNLVVLILVPASVGFLIPIALDLVVVIMGLQILQGKMFSLSTSNSRTELSRLLGNLFCLVGVNYRINSSASIKLLPLHYFFSYIFAASFISLNWVPSDVNSLLESKMKIKERWF